MCLRISQYLWQSPEVDGFHEAIPVWERAYAVTKTKRCVEGAAGTRGADETITEGLFVTPAVNRNNFLLRSLPIFDTMKLFVSQGGAIR